jgi:hypothetical protein
MPSNAAIYIADPSILGSRTLDEIADIESYEGLNQNQLASGFRLRLAWGVVTVNFMPAEQLPNHLHGFASYAEKLIKNQDTLIYALARIHHVRMCLGCVIEHTPESELSAQEFLFRLNNELNGLLFLYDTIFDKDGKALGKAGTVQ